MSANQCSNYGLSNLMDDNFLNIKIPQNEKCQDCTNLDFISSLDGILKTSYGDIFYNDLTQYICENSSEFSNGSIDFQIAMNNDAEVDKGVFILNKNNKTVYTVAFVEGLVLRMQSINGVDTYSDGSFYKDFTYGIKWNDNELWVDNDGSSSTTTGLTGCYLTNREDSDKETFVTSLGNQLFQGGVRQCKEGELENLSTLNNYILSVVPQGSAIKFGLRDHIIANLQFAVDQLENNTDDGSAFRLFFTKELTRAYMFYDDELNNIDDVFDKVLKGLLKVDTTIETSVINGIVQDAFVERASGFDTISQTIWDNYQENLINIIDADADADANVINFLNSCTSEFNGDEEKQIALECFQCFLDKKNVIEDKAIKARDFQGRWNGLHGCYQYPEDDLAYPGKAYFSNSLTYQQCTDIRDSQTKADCLTCIQNHQYTQGVSFGNDDYDYVGRTSDKYSEGCKKYTSGDYENQVYFGID